MFIRQDNITLELCKWGYCFVYEFLDEETAKKVADMIKPTGKAIEIK